MSEETRGVPPPEPDDVPSVDLPIDELPDELLPDDLAVELPPVDPAVDLPVDPAPVDPAEEPGELAVAGGVASTPEALDGEPARPGEEARRRNRELFAALKDPGTDPGEHDRLRDELVRLHLPLVEHCARRFRNRGEPWDDLVQVGTIGLIKAVDRFEPSREVEFSSYATPTILGEIKRHFRDRGWAIRVPRRLQELRMQITTATAELTQSLGRSPTPRELAQAVGCSVEDIIEGLESGNAYATLSLDAGDEGDEGAPSILDTIGEVDESLEHIEIRESLRPLLDKLDAREKKILLLRFFKNMTQSQIAAEIGVSQMHVSRLLTRTLESLRSELAEPE